MLLPLARTTTSSLWRAAAPPPFAWFRGRLQDGSSDEQIRSVDSSGRASPLCRRKGSPQGRETGSESARAGERAAWFLLISAARWQWGAQEDSSLDQPLEWMNERRRRRPGYYTNKRGGHQRGIGKGYRAAHALWKRIENDQTTPPLIHGVDNSF